MPYVYAAERRLYEAKSPIILRDTRAALAILTQEKTVAFDLETSGLSPWKDCIAVVTLNGLESGVTAVLHLRGAPLGDLVEFFNNPTKTFVGHNCASFDCLFLANAGVNIHSATYYDTLVGEQITNLTDRKDVRFSLKASAYRQLGIELKKDADHEGWMNSFLTEQQIEYCADDVKYIHELRAKQIAKAQEKGISRALALEMQLVPIVAQITLNGLPINLERLWNHLAIERKEVEEALFRLYDIFGTFNPGSPVQVKKALLTVGIDLRSTAAAEILDLIANGGEEADILRDIRICRTGKKRINQYDAQWVTKYVEPDGRIHPKYWIAGTATGRLCVSSKTLIECPRDMIKYPDGIPITEIKEGQWIYSFNANREMVLRKVKWVGKTGTKRTLSIKAKDEHTQDIVEIRVTPEHLVRNFQNHWIYAKDLRVGNRLMCVPQRKQDESPDSYYTWGARAQRKSMNLSQAASRIREHRWVYAQIHGLPALPSKWDVHHIDLNKYNNSPENLQLVLHAAHMKMHNQSISKEQVQDILEGLFDNPYNSMKYLRRLARKYGILPSNHTVISIEDYGEEEVWDLEVEDTHTFIGNGVALHNSSSSPNAQQWPRNMRHVIAPRDGFKMVCLDYKSAEVIVAAALSRDSTLLSAYEAGDDLHTAVASQVFGEFPADVTKAQRQMAKSMNFCLLFGGWYETLWNYARLSGAQISLDEAKEIEQRYFQTYRGIARMKQIARAMSSRGGPVTLTLPTGIKRTLIPAMGNPKVPTTKILNTSVQGTAAAGMKYSLINCYKEGLIEYIGVTVHDEIAGDCPEGVAQEVAEGIEKCMVRGMKESVECPIKVDVHIQDDWSKS